MTHNFISAQNGNVHYWISRCLMNAHADTIVFTHGLTADHSMFEKQISFFKHNYNILVWDVPLHGLSTPYHCFSYKNAAMDLNNILVKEQIEKVILAGMSMGGYVTQMFGYLYPQKTIAMVGIDTTPFGLSYYSNSDLWWLKKVAPMARCFTEGLLKKSMAKSVSATPYSYLKMLDILSSQSKESIIRQMDIAYAGFVKENIDMSFSFPILLLLGDKDKTGKVSQYNHAWHNKTNYPLIIIKNAAHFSNGDNAEDVNSAILEFIESTSLL